MSTKKQYYTRFFIDFVRINGYSFGRGDTDELIR
nr:MAG TPA: hypothetical protein [Caudoviricetes sp.]